MNEQQVISVLTWFAIGSLGVMGIFVGVIARWVGGKVEAAATKAELDRVESDLRQAIANHSSERQRRDEEVNRKLDNINSGVSETHRRIDSIFHILVKGKPS